MAFMDKGKRAAYGILVDYEWCTGCHTCEIACQMEKGYEIGQGGVKVFEFGPYQIEDDHWQFDYGVLFGEQCDLCAERTEKGKKPSCVKHCQAACMEYGKLDELAPKLAAHPKQTLFAL